MKVNLIVGIGVMLALAACEKDKEEEHNLNNEPEKINYYPLKAGSFWVYNTYKIDSVGNEELISENDTVEVIGDSVINGNVYKKILRKEFSILDSKEVFLERDSMDYVVNEKGDILFSQIHKDSILNVKNYPDDNNVNISFIYKIENWNEPVYLYGNTYLNVLNKKLIVRYFEEKLTTERYLNKFYAPDVGVILRQYSYTGLLYDKKEYYEERLINYQISEIIE